MNRQSAIAGMINAQTKPTVKSKSVDNGPSTSGYVGTLGSESLSRVRDRQSAEQNTPAAPLTEFESDVKTWGVQWATVYRDEKLARNKAERARVEAEKVRLAHAAEDERQREYLRVQRAAQQKQREENTRIILENSDKRAIRALLDSVPFGIAEKVIRLANGSTAPFVYEALLEEEKRNEAKT